MKNYILNELSFPNVVDYLEGPGVRKWQFKETGIKLVNIKNLVNDKLNLSNTSNYLDEIEVKNKYSHFLLKEKDFIIASSGVTWGKIAEIKPEHLPLCLNTSIIKIIPKNKKVLKRGFLWYFIKSQKFRRQINRLITGSAQPNFGPSHLKKIKIPLPPLKTQKRIVSLLDRAQALIDKRKEQIALMDQLIQSIFYDMFGDPVLNPMGWEVKKLGECITFITSGSRGWAKYYANRGNIFIRIQNIKNKKIDYSNLQYISTPNTKEAQRIKVKENDLVFSITADLGRAAVIDRKTAEVGAYINQHLCLIRLMELLNPLYAAYYIESEGGKIQIDKYNMVGVKSGLNFDSVKSLKILIPPLNLQNNFANRVKKIESQKQTMTTALKELENNFNSLMQRAFKGEI